MDVWLNGELVPEEQANISVFDSGLQHAVGLFETMHARNNRIFRVDQHMARLAESAKSLLMSTRLQPEALGQRPPNAWLRTVISVSRGFDSRSPVET